jgi:hypothetical protein
MAFFRVNYGRALRKALNITLCGFVDKLISIYLPWLICRSLPIHIYGLLSLDIELPGQGGEGRLDCGVLPPASPVLVAKMQG